MVQEVLTNDANQHSYIYTRQDWLPQFDATRVRKVPELPYVGSERWDEPFQWGSGPYAVLLSAKLCNSSVVRLIGFDLYSNTQTVNNIYKGSSNYNSANKRPVDPRYWIHQIGMIFKYYTKINFVVHCNDFELPKAWKQSNVSLDTLSSL
jgi:hypothetical protein|tara:strand:- start:69 stop:518 length:450 start_codon:yes stop_codon:yes gene_type:complete